LTIAGSDPSGGAGIQADLKTFAALGVYGAAAITALTAQNTLGVQGVSLVPPFFVSAQIESVLSDLRVAAAKVGMVASAAIASAVAKTLHTHRPAGLVVDPVMVATSGDVLLDEDAIAVVARELVPLADLVTPNWPEAVRLAKLAGNKHPEDPIALVEAIGRLGAQAVLLKGGHRTGDLVEDLLWSQGAVIVRSTRPRLETPHTHGTGCTLSAAIVARLAHGDTLADAVLAAIDYLHLALSRAYPVGAGRGPVHHFAALWPMA
jgi:hydroxymethylpyrimidine/phosphomethylpyrimidine kinase